MNPSRTLRRALALLLLLSVTACVEDPFDRIQGEPSEYGVTHTDGDEHTAQPDAEEAH